MGIIIIVMTDKDVLRKAMDADHPLPLGAKMEVVWKLSLPVILAQISEIAMQYIDAAMIGSLGASASAAIGLVASSTWLVGGLVMGTAAGFCVQIAHASGAKQEAKARDILRQGILVSLLISLVLAGLGSFVSFHLPAWLGADTSLWHDATAYFLVFALFVPVRMMFYLGQSALQSTGSMKIPGFLSAIMCVLDVFFNYLLIFPARQISLFGASVVMPGAGLGVMGAALGTAFSFVCAVIGVFIAIMHSSTLSLLKAGSWKLHHDTLHEAAVIGVPMALEQAAMTSAQVFSTRIVAPLGTNAIAANSFAVTAESICYMPGYGIQSAATTLVGQAVGARRKELAKSFGWLSTLMAMAIMAMTGFAMYFLCPFVFAFLTPVEDVRRLGASVLRIELLAEPWFAASIAASGVMRGAADTLVPGIMNLVSIWGVRIPLAMVLSKQYGLRGVWIGMAVELTFRGLIFLIRLGRGRWLNRAFEGSSHSVYNSRK